MALTACKECGKEISTEADACPHCGKKIERTSGCALVVAGIVLLGVFGSIAGSCEDSKKASVEAGRQAALTPEQREAEKTRSAAEAASKAKKEVAFQKVVVVLKTIKASARNPDSVVWESILANDDASVVCVEYRGQNGFGGMTREHIVVAKGSASQTPSAWNKHCAGKVLNDMIYARRAL